MIGMIRLRRIWVGSCSTTHLMGLFKPRQIAMNGFSYNISCMFIKIKLILMIIRTQKKQMMNAGKKPVRFLSEYGAMFFRDILGKLNNMKTMLAYCH
jgi:hypothetical protein